MKEEKRTQIWRITATTSLVVIFVVAVFFVIRIFTANPTSGTWTSVDSDLSLTIPNFGDVTVSWPESDSLSDVTVKVGCEVDRGRQIITLEPDAETVGEAAREAGDPDMLRADLSLLSGTFSYEASDDALTLTDPQFGDQISFEKAD